MLAIIFRQEMRIYCPFCNLKWKIRGLFSGTTKDRPGSSIQAIIIVKMIIPYHKAGHPAPVQCHFTVIALCQHVVIKGGKVVKG